MSQEPSVQDVVNHLLRNPQATVRVQAAQWLAEAEPTFNDAEYVVATEGLQQALADPDPSVVMAAMQAMTAFKRPAASDSGASDDDEAEAIAATCPVCSKPEFLIGAGGCDRPDCPYA